MSEKSKSLLSKKDFNKDERLQKVSKLKVLLIIKSATRLELKYFKYF